MKRRTLVRVAALLIGIPSVVLGCLLAYLRFADLSGWKDTVAEKISQSVGRKITIAGEFTPEIGLTTRLAAGEITIANPDWCSDATMASVHRLVFELNLWSLVSGPLTIHNVQIDGARILLEQDGDGRANWDFDTGADSDPSSGPLELVLQHVLLEDVQLTWREPSRASPLVAGIAHFETTEDHAGMLDLEFDGTIDDQKIGLSGRLGTLNGLLNAAAVSFDLGGTLDGVEFSSKGTIKELKTLDGVDVTADVHGDDLGDLRALIDLPAEATGPFSVSAAVSPATAGSGLQLDAAAAGINATVSGTVDSLVKPKIFDATVTASGPSIRTVGALTGVADLPDDGFSVSGGIRWEGFPITFKKVDITVGENSLSVDGVLGAPPKMMGSDFTVQGKGPDLSSIGALAGIDLPRDRFSIEGRVVRVDAGIDVETLEAQIGRTTVTASGTVGDPPDYAGTTLSIHAEGPNVAHFNHLIGIELPAQAFTVDGRLAQGQEAITLEGVTARLGGTSLRVDGLLRTAKGLTGTSLRIEAKGPDAALLRLLTDLDDLPDEPWSLAGGLDVLSSGFQLKGVSANVGSLRARANGRVATDHRAIGTKLRLHAEDSDLSHALKIFGVDGFPRQPVRVDGGLSIVGSGYILDGVTATAGNIEIAVDGQIGDDSDLAGTQAHLEVHGPQLSSLGPFFDFPGLPQAPFSVAGNVRVTGGRVDLDDVVAVVDSNRVTVHGAIGTAEGLIGTDVQVGIAAPDFQRAGRLAAGLAKLPELPAETLTLTTHLRIDDAGYEIAGFRATLDKAVAALDGRIGSAANWVGTDLRMNVNGPNASLFSALAGVSVPVAPFSVRGRLQRTDAAFLFERVAVELGGHSIALHGTLGERPRLVGTDLEFSASGPSTALIAELTGYHTLPDEAFSIGGHFEGTPERFTADDLDIVLGPSDLKGSLRVDIRGKPVVTARLTSNELVITPYIRRQAEDTPAGDETVDAQKKEPRDGLAITNRPIDFGPLQSADADVTMTVGELHMPLTRFHDVEIDAHLADGRLEIRRFGGKDQRNGSASGGLILEPVGQGYRVAMDLAFADIRLDLTGPDTADAAFEPPINFDVRLDAQGSSPHEFASSSNGTLKLVIGKGVMANEVLDMVTADILLTLLNAFNPFAKENIDSELECAVVLVNLDQGIATLSPMALQSDKMTMLGKGRLDLGTEKLNLEWITKPRKGIGLSASIITNPYIKLGGTLAKPAIELKGAQAVASTGVAVATMGISLVAKGMFDRVTAEKKVCKKALEEIATSGQNN